jgi:hypothetical protein
MMRVQVQGVVFRLLGFGLPRLKKLAECGNNHQRLSVERAALRAHRAEENDVHGDIPCISSAVNRPGECKRVRVMRSEQPLTADGDARTHDGIRLAYTLYGRKDLKRAVLVHSLAMDRSFWRPVAERLNNDVQAYGETCRMLGVCDLRAVLPRLTMPAAIVVGEEDYATPVDMARIAGSTLTAVKGARHLTPLEVPDRIAAELRRLLESVRWS